MEITRELELDASPDEVWELLSDPDELAAWVGDEVRGARLDPALEGVRRLGWTWAPDGIESEVQVVVEEVGDRSVVRIVERSVTGAARACSIGDAWDERLFGLEVRCLTRQHALVGLAL
ncbi:MAG: SRPBCC family protein [Acidimicrobiia bacterium]|nr:SRPBCC family protein [Acidimicrobiia bacterium]